MRAPTTFFIAVAFVLLSVAVVPQSTPAQPPGLRQVEPSNPHTEVRYGSKVPMAFSASNQFHRFTLVGANEGERVRITVKPAVESLRTRVGLFDPNDHMIAAAPMPRTDGRGKTQGDRSRFGLRTTEGLVRPQLVSRELPASGTYQIEVFNGLRGEIGRYQLIVEGIMPDGTVRDQLDAPKAAATGRPASAPASAPAAAPAVPAFGFPGLPPVDFGAAVTMDLPESGEVRGKINSERDSAVRGYTFTPSGEGAYEVALRRTKGSGAIGLVILSDSNAVLAQSSLAASDRLTTTLVFPKGASTIGVFRQDLGQARPQWPTEYELKVKPSAGR